MHPPATTAQSQKPYRDQEKRDRRHPGDYAVYERDPALAIRLTQAFAAAKRIALEAYDEGLSTIPWVNLDLEYARGVLGEDICPYGVKNNLPTLEAATLYSHEQGLTPRRFAVEELFAPETLEL